MFEHLEEVARERDVARQPLREEGIDLHEPNGDVDAGPVDAADTLQALPELVPADDVGAPQLEEAAHHIVALDGLRKVLRQVFGPDRLDALAAAADDRGHGRQPCELHERRQDAAPRPEDEARPEDHVGDARSLHLLLVLPLRSVVGHEILRLLARAEGAHVHEAPNPGVLCSSEEIARALDHDPLELLAPALPDRYEMNDRVDAGDGGSQALRVGDVALGQVASPRRGLCCPAQVTNETAHGEAAAAQLVDDVAAHEAGAPRDEDQPVGSFLVASLPFFRSRLAPRAAEIAAYGEEKEAGTSRFPGALPPPARRRLKSSPLWQSFASTSRGSARAGPGTSSRCHRCRTASVQAR